MPILKMSDLKLKGKRVLIREDLNVPVKNGEITSDARIRAAIPTIKQALKGGAQVILMSHLGRPEEGIHEEQFSLAPVAIRLSQLLKIEVPLVKDWLRGVSMKNQSIVLLENVRFHSGETENNLELAKKMAALCDIYVMDAFATSHRMEASTCGIIRYAPIACAGPLLAQELEALSKIMQKPKSPVVAIVGGSKVSTKLALLDTLSQKVDTLIIGGGIANTFIAAEGYTVGRSLYEPDLIDEAERLALAAKKRGADIPVPTDVIVADKLSEEAESSVRLVSQVDDNEKIYDLGPDTIKKLVSIIKKAKTILWNGPVGAFEIEQFSEGTKAIAKAIAESKGYSVAGGGDTLAAIEKYHVGNKIDYISTGGGAFLSFLEGKPLPAVTALEERATKDEKVT
ncbi:MAG TPA: phosphoglycerate kinase [Gammaproteobacteria bacterium]|nr:phosphoglycerate kinase [Gammaproteobacteria bacterium]